jgi:tight adherence protein B
MKSAIYFICFINISLIIYIILKLLTSKNKSIYRIKKYFEIKDYNESDKNQNINLKTILKALSKSVVYIKALDYYREKVQYELSKAHIPLKSEEFIIIRVISSLLLLIVSYLAFNNLTIIVISAVLGYIGPNILLNLRIKRRQKQFNEQLGDATVMISNSLKAGYSFIQSIEMVAREMNGPIAEEFAYLIREINLGVDTEEGLNNLLERVRSDDMDLVITAVLIQRQVGGNLSTILDNISNTIRERVKIKGEVKTITAQGRISGMIISILPPGLGLVLCMINPEHMKVLFSDKLGIVIIGLSIFMELLGIYFIRRIVKIEV